MHVKRIRIIQSIMCLLLFLLIGLSFINYCYKEKYTEEIVTNNSWEHIYSDIIEQYFVSDYNSISSIGFNVLTYERENQGSLDVKLYDEEINVLIDQWDMKLSECQNGEYCRFTLQNPEKNAFGKTYKIEITVRGKNLNNSICFPVERTETANDDFATIDGETNDQLYRLNYLIGSFPDKKNIVLILTIFVVLYLLFLVFYEKISYSKLLIVLIAVLGGMYIFVIPRMAVPDEPAHYQRAYEVSTGHFLATHTENGGYSVIPENLLDGNGDYVTGKESVYEEQRSTFGEKLSDKEILYSNINQALYSPFAYTVQAIGLFCIRHISSASGIVFYAGRIAALIFSCILLTLSARMIPTGKKSILLIVAMPMFIQQMISYSCDATVNTLAIFFVSYIMYLKTELKKIRWYDYVILGVTCFMIAMSKIVYLPFVFLVCLLPNQKFQTKIMAYIVKGSMIGASVLANLIWLAISSTYMVETNPGVMPSQQVKYVLTHPVRYIGTAFQTIYESGNTWLYEMVGTGLGWFQIAISMSVIFLFIIMLLFDFSVSTKDEKKFEILKIEKLIIIGVVLIIVALTFTSLYVQWTPLQKSSIDGIQGRYFIPLLLPLALCMPKIKLNIEQKDLLKIYVPVILEINLLALLTIYCFFA